MDKIERVKQITAELLHYCHEYYDMDAPTISDAEYDRKFDELVQLEQETNFYLANSPAHKVQGEVLPFLTKVHHSVPMLSAAKSTDIADVRKFVGNHDVVVSYKLDGGTVVVKYSEGKFVQALSRGSGEDGEDITHTAKMIKNLPMTIPYNGYLEVRGEALIPWKYYNEMNIDGSLGHPRNVATGSLRQLDTNEAAKRNIYFYAFTLVNWKDVKVATKYDSLQLLKNNGFDVVPYVMRYSTSSIDEKIEFLDRKSYENPTDGWCFEYNDLAYGESLGSTGHHDRRLFALKPERAVVDTTLIDIDWTMGKTGVLTPTAIMQPVEIDNTIVERASLHNISVMKSLNLSMNCGVKLYKANMIVPQIDSCFRDGDASIEIPSVCPVCGGTTQIVKENNSEVLMCTNPSCGGKLLGQLAHAVSKKALDISGLSEATLQWLIDIGWVSSIIDLYNLSSHAREWMTSDGFGKTSVNKILASIEKSRDTTLDRFICALSIDGVGSSASKTISSYFHGNFNNFDSAWYNRFDFTKLDDVGDTTARNIDMYMANHHDKVELLAEKMRFAATEKKVVAENQFTGKTIVVTGALHNFTRDTINEKIAEIGAKTAGSVSKKTDYLLTNEASGSSKYMKAMELGIPIISEDEFIIMCGEIHE